MSMSSSRCVVRWKETNGNRFLFGSGDQIEGHSAFEHRQALATNTQHAQAIVRELPKSCIEVRITSVSS